MVAAFSTTSQRSEMTARDEKHLDSVKTEKRLCPNEEVGLWTGTTDM